MEDVIENVSQSMIIIFEGLRFVQRHEDVIAKRTAARAVELLRRRKVRQYSKLETDTKSAARISVGDTPFIIDYGIFEPYLRQIGLPALTIEDPRVLRAREYVGKELYKIIAKTSKTIAEQRTIRFGSE